MFKCLNCKLDCKSLICGKDKIYCELCYVRPDYRPSYLHEVVAKDGVTKVTRAKANIMDNRVISPVDHKTVIDRRTGKPTEY